MNIYVSDLQAALFTPSLDLSNKIGLASAIIEATKGLFDGNPTMLNVPSDAPAEIPRLILKNPDSSYMLQMGLNRMDFFYHDKSMTGGIPTKKMEDVKVDFLAKLASINSTVKKVTGSKIVRLGFVPTLIVKNDNGASKFIRETYFNLKKVEEEINEVSFSTSRRSKLDSFNINIGIRGNAFRKPKNDLDDKVSVFNVDINTFPEQLLDLKVEEMNKFFTLAFEHIEKNLHNYII